ncbi:mitochondrial genome maintenance exonuclease 1-like [Dendronephthya gigantea]|uniref:mitochondrial genome maintenance exonuclease 1-like n=1 Tax=Dendronephthya gigantea TaxID=151771 RepID=UPI00106A1D37|nr:mitochondrial genome maintenance exonuclease 1-like [Dendronephthya gigantea]
MQNFRRIAIYRNAYKSMCNVLVCHLSSFQNLGGGVDHGSREGRWFTPGEIGDMSRRELQAWCKKLGIPANTKTIKMQADLLDFYQNILSNSYILNYPFNPMQSSSLYPGNMMRGARQEKLLFYNSSNAKLLSDTAQVRYFKNKSCMGEESIYEDADCYLDQLKPSEPEIGLPSVSKILRSTAPKSKLFAISCWTKQQKELLGEDGFRQKMNEIKKKGTDFHHFIHRCLIGKQLHDDIPEKLQGYLTSARTVFGELGDAIASEKCVSHANLGYHGKFDTLACYHGNPCIIEWKTSQQKKSTLKDCGEHPLQMVAYAGAINSDLTNGLQVWHGLLVYVYEDGSPADVHFLDLKQCKGFWQDWLVRLFKFRRQ